MTHERTPWTLGAAFACGAFLVCPAPAAGQTPDKGTSRGPQASVREVEVVGPDVKFGDLFAGAPREVSERSIGPAPAPGASRLVERHELEAIARAHNHALGAGHSRPVRLVRKMKRLSEAEVREIARLTLAPVVPKGVLLTKVHVVAPVSLPEGWDTVRGELPSLPKKAGGHSCTASLTFLRGETPWATLSVPLELRMSAEAAVPDVVHGSTVTVAFERGLVVVSATGVTSADGDIGGVVPVTIRGSFKSVRARLVSRDRAVVVETP